MTQAGARPAGGLEEGEEEADHKKGGCGGNRNHGATGETTAEGSKEKETKR